MDDQRAVLKVIRRRVERLIAVQEMATDDLRRLLDDIDELADELPRGGAGLVRLMPGKPYPADAAVATDVHESDEPRAVASAHAGRGLGIAHPDHDEDVDHPQ